MADINPVAGFVAGMGMLAEDNQLSYAQRLEQNDALNVLSDEIKIKNKLEVDQLAQKREQRSAWDQAHQEVGVQIASMSSKVVSILSDKNLKTPAEVDEAVKPYFDRMAEIEKDDRYKTSDFQTMIDSAVGVTRAVIQQKKDDQEAFVKLKGTWDSLLSLQAGEGVIKSGPDKGKPSGKSTGDYSSTVTSDGVAKILQNTGYLRDYFATTKDDAAIKILDAMEERARKVSYTEQRLNDFDADRGPDNPFVQFDKDYINPDTGEPGHGPAIKSQVRTAEGFLKAGLWEQAYNTMAGVEANLARDRASIGGMIGAREEATRGILLNNFKTQQEVLKNAYKKVATSQSLTGSGLVNVVSVDTGKD